MPPKLAGGIGLIGAVGSEGRVLEPFDHAARPFLDLAELLDLIGAPRVGRLRKSRKRSELSHVSCVQLVSS